MSDLLHIGRSGLLAARDALSVTSDNVANAQTPGYRRREALMHEIIGGAGTEVTDIRRAVDTLLEQRARDTGSARVAAETYQSYMAALEERLLPGQGNIQESLGRFFDAIDVLAQIPDDAGLRQGVLIAGEAFAARVRDVAAGLSSLEATIASEREQTVTDANILLTQLERIEKELASNFNGQDLNPLFDQRDEVLAKLADISPIEVEFDRRNRVFVRLADGAGPPVFERGKAAALSVAEDGRLEVRSQGAGTASTSILPSSGSLGGLADAMGALKQAQTDLNVWAADVAAEFNSVHGQGITAEGESGTEMFRTDGWIAEDGALTRGDAYVELKQTDPNLAPDGPLTLVYDATQGAWLVQDENGGGIDQGTDHISLPGLEITISGRPVNGDRITLSQRGPEAGLFAFVLNDVNEIAAGGSLTVGAASGNTGSGSIVASLLEGTEPQIAGLSQLLSDGEAIEFVSSGVVGFIPSETSSASLSAQPRLAAMEFSWPTDGSASELSVTRGGDSIVFPVAPGGDLDSFVGDLQNGRILANTGQSLAELGLVAAEVGGALLVLDQGGGLPDSAVLQTTSGASPGNVVASAADAAELSLFTRDGRQLAGPPLSPQEALTLLTPENGFLAEAAHNLKSLGAAETVPQIIRSSGAGDFALLLDTPVAAGLTTWSGATGAAETSARSISVQTDAGSFGVDIPAGASAARMENLLEDALPLSVEAETRLALDLPSSGALSFQLSGANLDAIAIDVSLTNDGASALAAAVNAHTGSSGIHAEVSNDGSRLQLVHQGGENIVIAGLKHSLGEAVAVTRLSSAGETLGTVSLESGVADSVRVLGAVELASEGAFSVQESGGTAAAIRDPAKNGSISMEGRAARSELLLSLPQAATDDFARRGMVVTGADGRLHQYEVSPTGAGATSLAASFAADMRATAPASRITGASIAELPPDGSQMVVTLGDDEYSITMRAGVPEVEGPENGRISVSFDASNSLVIETEGGHLDGAALRLAGSEVDAHRFGLGPSHGPITTVIGQPFDAANLPSSLTVRLGGVDYSITVSTGAVVLPPSFPGTGYINTSFGRVELQFDARAGDLTIPAQQGSADAGFDTFGLSASVNEDQLLLAASDGRQLEVSAAASSAGTTLRVAQNSGEDLVVVLSGMGGLRLAGDLNAGAPTTPRSQEIRVIDSEAGIVGLFDSQTDTELARRGLDSSGNAEFEGLRFSLQGAYSTGDVFSIEQSTGSPGDGRTLTALGELRLRNPESGLGGFSADFAAFQQRIGAQIVAGESRLETARSASESARRAISELSGVNLDEEAADMIRHQQSYQANAQAINVAREIFDTLLRAL